MSLQGTQTRVPFIARGIKTECTQLSLDLRCLLLGLGLPFLLCTGHAEGLMLRAGGLAVAIQSSHLLPITCSLASLLPLPCKDVSSGLSHTLGLFFILADVVFPIAF